ncbi:MAG: DUF1501 domain-containing protein [Victivallales bacterium]
MSGTDRVREIGRDGAGCRRRRRCKGVRKRTTKEMRDRYGRKAFGQCCLAARLGVEAGVPYITIDAGVWDTHKKHFEAMKKLGTEMDQGFAAMLEDLSEKKTVGDPP